MRKISTRETYNDTGRNIPLWYSSKVLEYTEILLIASYRNLLTMISRKYTGKEEL